MIRLVVNADNLGESASADLAIVRAHQHGIVTSASLVGNAPAPRESLDRLRDAPNLGLGLALALTGGRPIAPASEVASLVTAGGELRADPMDLAVAWMAGRIVPAHAERELDAQIRRAQQLGVTVDHLNTRAHVGFLPGIARIVETLARRHGIAGMRTTVEPPTLSWVAEPQRALQVGVLGGLAWLARRHLGARAHGPATWGYVEAGRLDEVRILELIGRMGPGAHELICHPQLPEHGQPEQVGRIGQAPQDARSQELAALVSTKVRSALAERNIVLCQWRDLF